MNNNSFPSSGTNKAMMLKIAGGFILFTVILFLLIISLTSSDDSVSTGGAFASGEAFRQSSELEKKPKMQSANPGVGSTTKKDDPCREAAKKGNLAYFDCINEKALNQMHAEADAYEAKRKEALMGGSRQPSAKKETAKTEAAKPAGSKKSSAKKAKTKTNIPRMTLGFGSNSVGRNPNFVGSDSRGGAASSDSSGMEGLGGLGGLGEGMPDLSSLQGADGQVDQSQLNNLMKNLPTGN